MKFCTGKCRCGGVVGFHTGQLASDPTRKIRRQTKTSALALTTRLDSEISIVDLTLPVHTLSIPITSSQRTRASAMCRIRSACISSMKSPSKTSS